MDEPNKNNDGQNGKKSHPGLLTLSGAFVCWCGAFFAWTQFPSRPIPANGIFETLTPHGRMFYHPEYDILIYLVAGLLAVFTVVVLEFAAKRRQFSKPNIFQSADASKSPRFSWRDLLVITGICCALWIPYPARLVEIGYKVDRFEHIDFYLMGPLQAYRHGAALGTEFYSQYGCGWVLIFSSLASLFTVDYPFVVGSLPIFGSLYFISVFLVVRRYLSSSMWGLVGVMTAIFLQMFCGTEAYGVWLLPASTVLRCPFDMLIVLLLCNISNHLNRIKGLAGSALIGFLAGLSILFGTDTGFYICAGLGMVSLLVLREYIQKRQSRSLIALAGLWTATLFVAMIGLCIASRGTIFQKQFWTGYLEVLWLYPSGFSSVPISAVTSNALYFTVFLLILMTYTLKIGRVLSRAVIGQPREYDLATAFLATVGFGTLTLFVNRSTSNYLFHSIVPAAVFWTITIAELGDRISSHSKQKQNHRVETLATRRPSRALATTSFFVLVLAFLCNSNFMSYPSVAAMIVNRITRKTTSIEEPLELFRFMRIAGTNIREIAGDKSYTLVGEDVTPWLVTLDLKPNGRYCPAALLTYEDERRLVSELNSDLVVVVRSGWLTGNRVEMLIRTKFPKLLFDSQTLAVYSGEAISKDFEKTKANPVP